MRTGTRSRGGNSHLPEEGNATCPARPELGVLAATITGAIGWTAVEACQSPHVPCRQPVTGPRR
jgi:hypothetical protein